MKLYLMCGLAFAGKSTVGAKIALQENAVLISLDQINSSRGLTGGTGIPDSEWAHSHQLALQELDKTLESGRSAVIDDTNCFRFLRDNYRGVANRFGAETIVVYLDVPFEVILQRMRENQASPTRPIVTEEVMRDLVDKFERPQSDERVVYSINEI